MPRTTMLKRELNSIPLPELLELATTGDGVAHHCCYFYAGAMPGLVMLAIGPAAEAWLAMVEQYHKEMGGQTDESANGEAPAQG